MRPILFFLFAFIVLHANAQQPVATDSSAFYKAAISSADSAFSSKLYSAAHKKYTEALKYKPGDSYAIDKLKLMTEKYMYPGCGGVMEKYQAAMAKGDKAFSYGRHEDAKAAYTEALSLKPNEKYPKDKIVEIEQLLKQPIESSKYKQAIEIADSLFAAKKWADAKVTYTKALHMKPNEPYPKDKIAEIDKILAAPVKKSD